MITQARLKELFSYCPATGLFTAVKKRQGSRIPAGGVVPGADRGNGYLTHKIDYKQYSAHRLAWFYMYGFLPGEIDHKNRDKTDNRICNLRIATKSMNQKNRGLLSNNTSGVAGVHLDNSIGKWMASITRHGKRKVLGRYKTKEEAIAARKAAEKKSNYMEVA